MCGRITRTSPREAVAKEFGVTRFAEVDWHPWGLVSSTAKEPRRSRPDRSRGLAIVLSLVVFASIYVDPNGPGSFEIEKYVLITLGLHLGYRTASASPPDTAKS